VTNSTRAEEKRFEGIATGDKPWFQYSRSYPSSKMFARLPTDVILRTQQAIGTNQTLITLFFTGRKLIVLDLLPKGGKFNQLYFVDYIFPDLKWETGIFIVGSHRRIFGDIWAIQFTTMTQKWYQNSRSLMFHDYHTHPIRQT
jgi:hypothetical protein